MHAMLAHPAARFGSIADRIERLVTEIDAAGEQGPVTRHEVRNFCPRRRLIDAGDEQPIGVACSKQVERVGNAIRTDASEAGYRFRPNFIIGERCRSYRTTGRDGSPGSGTCTKEVCSFGRLLRTPGGRL